MSESFVNGIVIGVIGLLWLQNLSKTSKLLFTRPAAPQPKTLPRLRKFPPPRFSENGRHIWN